MEWIIYAFFGVLGLLVFGIIGFASYTAFLGKGKDMPNAGPNMGAHGNDALDQHRSIGNSGGGGGGDT